MPSCSLFLLLMWKNFIVQYRRVCGVLFQIILPLIFMAMLFIFRVETAVINEEEHDAVVFKEFCACPFGKVGFFDLCDEDDYETNFSVNYKNYILAYSPQSYPVDSVMVGFSSIFNDMIGFETAKKLDEFLKHPNRTDVFAAIEFDDDFKELEYFDDVTNFKIAIRFPDETRFQFGPAEDNNWKTDRTYPSTLRPGPRAPESNTGAFPSYYMEGFLGIQQLLASFLMIVKSGLGLMLSIDSYPSNMIPKIKLKRFPHSKWIETSVSQETLHLLPLLILGIFFFPFLDTVKYITLERTQQLKEFMKMTGLPNWMQWMAWFVNFFLLLLILTVILVILLSVTIFGKNYPLAMNTDLSCLFFFLLIYICAIITFCFAVTVCCKTATSAVIIGGMLFIWTFLPYILLYPNYYKYTFWLKIICCLCSNTAMAFGVLMFISYNGTDEGIKWKDIFKLHIRDDSLTLGLVMVMLVVDTLIYLLIALYVEAVFPGKGGVAQPWKFLCTTSYWHDTSDADEESRIGSRVNEGEYFEAEPEELRAGIQMRKLRKAYDGSQNVAVKKISLNAYQGMVTALLGAKGSGKSTTIGMLMGRIKPTKGAAKVGRTSIRANMKKTRRTMGMCPQYNTVFNQLTVAEHLYFVSRIRGLEKTACRSEIERFIKILKMEEQKDKRVSKLSYSLKRKLSVGMALCGHTKVVLLDEPTFDMEFADKKIVWNVLSSLKQGRTILMTTQIVDEADAVGDKIAVLVDGKLKCCGSSEFLMKTFNLGYRIILRKSKRCDPAEVVQLLSKYLPKIEILSVNGPEVILYLPEVRLSRFEMMLKGLEDNLSRLGVRNYSVSWATFDEVFTKFDFEQAPGTSDNQLLSQRFSRSRINIGIRPAYSDGSGLMCNQFRAMIWKKFLAMSRSWLLLLIHVLVPCICIVIGLLVDTRTTDTGSATSTNRTHRTRPPLPLNLDKFNNSVTLVEFKDRPYYSEHYENLMKEYGYKYELPKNITARMLELTKTSPRTARHSYIIGVTMFHKGLILGWFNNDPYHSPAISLAMLLNAVFKDVLDCPKCSIRFINKPMPYKERVQTDRTKDNIKSDALGVRVSLILGLLAMPIGTAYLILFTVKENASKSRHLQYVSGTNIIVFWAASILWDLLIYLIIVVVVLITIGCFKLDGFKTLEDIGRLFLLFFFFFWAFLPMIYIAAYWFDCPITAYIRISLIMIFIVVIVLAVKYQLNQSGLDYVNMKLDWLFLLIPHYSLITGILRGCDYYMLQEAGSHPCEDLIGDSLRWTEPGIGRNLLFSFLEGAILFTIFLCNEYELFHRLGRLLSKSSVSAPEAPRKEDAEVANIRSKLNDVNNKKILESMVVLRNLTKYYNGRPVVNNLCLAVEAIECFGLSGPYKCGKSTMIKMLSGEVRSSSGDIWVKGYNIRTYPRQLHKHIAYCPRDDALLDFMTVKETITMYALIRGIRYKDRKVVIDAVTKELDFVRYMKNKVKELSDGNRRKLSIAITLIGDPPVYFYDEPTAGLDSVARRFVWRTITRLRDSGKCIIIGSHHIEECMSLCSRLAIIINGQFKYIDSPDKLKTKFADGYTLSIKFLTAGEDTKPIDILVKSNFPNAELLEQRDDFVTYYIISLGMPVSLMYGIMEKAKRSGFNIDKYFLAQSSLEQIYLTLSKV